MTIVPRTSREATTPPVPRPEPTPLVLDVRPTPRPGFRSPLEPVPGNDRWPTVLRGGAVFGDVDRAGISARVAYYRLPLWRRLFAPRPPSGRHLVAADLQILEPHCSLDGGRRALTRAGAR